MNSTTPIPSANTTVPTTQALAHWIKPGQTLMVRNRVLLVSECQVVFAPEVMSQKTIEDTVEAVNFWFDKPVEGSITHWFNQATNNFEPVTSKTDLENSQLAWVIQYTGQHARAIRRLYKHFHKLQK